LTRTEISFQKNNLQGRPAARIGRCSPARHPSSLGDAVASISIRKTRESNVHKQREKVSGKSHWRRNHEEDRCACDTKEEISKKRRGTLLSN